MTTERQLFEDATYNEDKMTAWEVWQAARASSAAAQWLPIAGAPKEEELLGWREDCGVLIIMHTSYDRFATQKECDETDEETLFQKDWWGAAIPGGFQRLEGSEVPTHWMPLPGAPK